MPSNHLGIFFPSDCFKKFGLFKTKFKYRADYQFILNLLKHDYKPVNVNFKIGAFRLGGISGGYGTFIENYKAIRSVGGNFLIAAFSTLFSLSKLFFQRNLPKIYKLVSLIYYKFNLGSEKREVFKDYKKQVIHIIESDTGGGAEKLLHILAQNSKIDQKVIFLSKINNNHYHKSNYFFLNIKANGIMKIFIASCAIFKFLLKEKNKEKILIHSHLGKALYSAFMPSIFLGINHIHTEHNTFNRRRFRFYLYWIEYVIYSSLKHIICISEPTRFELLSYMPSIHLSKTTVIKNGTKLYKHKNRNFNKKKLNLLVLGSLTYKKGIDLLIQILPDLLQIIDHIKIVGSGPEKENLINLTKKLSLENYVKFIPFLEDPSPEIYSSHLGVIPSRWEGFGLVAAEMRSSGLPILISDTPGLYDIYSEYNSVYSFKNGSIHSLKESLTDLIKNLNLGKDKILNLDTSFENFSEQSFRENYFIFYKNNFNL
jgi:glycosyltransferase involved in cell wall biosynthesis